jgi:hypothetical protein
MTFLFSGKHYPVADEISVEEQPPSGAVVEFSYHNLYRAYKENGKYYISHQNLKYPDSTPEIFEISAKEYRRCAGINPGRLDNFDIGYGSGSQYDVKVRYGKDVKDYSVKGWPSPLYELEELYDTKVRLGEQETYRDSICGALTELFDCSSTDAAYVTYPSEWNTKKYFYYGDVSYLGFDDAYRSLAIRHYCNQTININLMKLYEDGTISEPDLKAAYEEKKQIYEKATGKEFLEKHGTTPNTEKYLIENKIGAIHGNIREAYSDITGGTNGMIYYEIVVPDDDLHYTVGVKKSALMPTWYLRMALDHILISDGNTIPWGKLYIFMLSFIPAVAGCLVIWKMNLGDGVRGPFFKKRK